MIEIKEKKDCCGCDACVNICPKNCISMHTDKEGFWYPEVNKQDCIKCNLCVKACPVLSSVKKEEFKIEAFACKNNNNDVRKDSSSGGVFFALCENVIGDNGVVFGAAFNDEMEVEHSFSDTLEGCIKFRGSKYVQSKIGDSYKVAKKFLDEGRKVLFTGTQCEIKGLRLFLRKNYENLIAVDIICHGVPSPKVFKLYRESLSNKYNSKIKSIKFRDKSKGWKNFSYVTEFEDGRVYSKPLGEDTYMRGFLRDLYLRPSCYHCKAKNHSSGSDISLADYWGVESIHNEIDDDKGISLVIIGSEKGMNISKDIEDRVEFLKTDLNHATKYNSCIVKPVKENNNRDNFFKKMKKSKSIEKTIIKYCEEPTLIIVKKRIIAVLVRIKRLLIAKK